MCVWGGGVVLFCFVLFRFVSHPVTPRPRPSLVLCRERVCLSPNYHDKYWTAHSHRLFLSSLFNVDAVRAGSQQLALPLLATRATPAFSKAFLLLSSISFVVSCNAFLLLSSISFVIPI